MSAYERYEHNCILENAIRNAADDSGHINGQGREPVGSMRFGAVSAAFASCEAVAVRNVLHDLGIHRRLSDVFYDTERLGCLFLFGIFGTRIGKIGRLLSHYGVAYQKIKPAEFEQRFESDSFPNDQKFIITIKNRSDVPISSLHTFEAVINSGRLAVYNRFSQSKGPQHYSNLSSLLSNGSRTGKLYSVYMISEHKDEKNPSE